VITSNDDERTFIELSLLTGIPVEAVESLFAAFQIQFAINYNKNKSIKIPFVGSFLVRYRGESITDEGKEAQLDSFFAPHPQLVRLVGQLHDIEASGNFKELDVLSICKKILKQDFKTKIDDDKISTVQ
jgi:hypothetical protein